ncbi:MAG: hypothetical protein EBR46_03400 [Betaproteobacteria bacterium]|nr:hypothetical protein [Betaproteobacteria bacterium]
MLTAAVIAPTAQTKALPRAAGLRPVRLALGAIQATVWGVPGRTDGRAVFGWGFTWVGGRWADGVAKMYLSYKPVPGCTHLYPAVFAFPLLAVYRASDTLWCRVLPRDLLLLCRLGASPRPVAV